MPYIKHQLGKTYYKVAGRKNKNIPLVFLHGGPGGTLKSNEPLLKLSSDRPVYIYDQLGCGRSSLTSSNKWNIETFVKELGVLIKKWKLSEFHLGGGSWGTTLALEYYLHTKGEGVKSIIFRSPMFSAKDWMNDSNMLINKMSKKNKKIIKYCQEVGATDSKVYKEATLAYYLKHVLRNKNLLLESMRAPKSKNIGGKKIYQHMWGPSEFYATGTLKSYNKVNSLKKIKVPTLLMCGEHDESTPRTTRKYSKLIRDSRLSILKGCSHSSLQEKPGLVLKEIKTFLKSTDF